MAKILVTGGTGLVGSAINADTKISSKDVDLTNPQETMDFFKKTSPGSLHHIRLKIINLIYIVVRNIKTIMIELNIIKKPMLQTSFDDLLD